MTYEEFLRFFEGQKMVREGKGWKVICPVHNDHNPSLKVDRGEKCILLHCFSGGCSDKDICEKLGIRESDLFYEPLQKNEKKPAQNRGRKAAPKAVRKPDDDAPPWEPKAEPKKAGKIVKIYPYVDENGKTLLEVLRYEPKDFRRRVPDPTQRDGYRYNDTNRGRQVLYRLPQVLEAVRTGEPVWVVEGEKDVETLERLGMVATCNAGGAAKVDKDGNVTKKWRPEYTETLRGARVVLIGDNDKDGEAHIQTLRHELAGVAAELHAVDIVKIWPECPEKGDVSDFAAAVGDDAARAALIPEQEAGETEQERAAALYAAVPGYSVQNGCICQETEKGTHVLGRFVAYPESIISRDNGQEISTEFRVRGWSASGEPLPVVAVPFSKFSAMSWVQEAWDVRANIMPGSTVKDRLRYVITEVAGMGVERETVYTHTGWRQVGGKRCYLYEGGCIGDAAARVELSSVLDGYRLDASGHDDGSTAMLLDMLRGCIEERVLVPLLGLVFLAPVRSLLEEAGYPPRFIMFLTGGTGTHKSTTEALMLSFFGHFSGAKFPASYKDTANAIESKAFALKDSLLVVDDYHPESSPMEKKRMESVVESMLRLYGDGASRGRMNSDMTLRPGVPCRSVCLSSGEYLPLLEQSSLARFYEVPIKKDSITVGDDLEGVQELARQGYLRDAMRRYIGWLMEHTDAIAEDVGQKFLALRKRAREEGGDMHGRSAEAVAHVMMGYSLMLQSMADCGEISQGEKEQREADAWRWILATSQEQARAAADETPTKVFLRITQQLIASGGINLMRLPVKSDAVKPINMAGYSDDSFYYLMPDEIFRHVSATMKGQGRDFPIGAGELWKRLREEGALMAANSGAPRRPKKVQGQNLNLIWIRKRFIDGTGQPTPEEQMMVDGFVEVDPEELPPEL